MMMKVYGKRVSVRRTRTRRVGHGPTRKANVNEKGLYPSLEVYRTGYLAVSPVHRIYFEESGNSSGKPAVFLHGGPGGATTPGMRSYFHPRRYRLVLFDQRGCGQSKPRASVVDNTTEALIADLELLRKHLGVERWLVAGCSWGATLALAYAQAYPNRVSELLLCGVFLARRSEIDWLYASPRGAASIFPDAWQDFVAPIARAERADLLGAYYRRLMCTEPKRAMEAARSWSRWENAISCLHASPELPKPAGRAVDVGAVRLECHYLVNGCFFESDGQLLKRVGRVRGIPTAIVQGRYDMVCPMRGAWELHKVWPEADLRIVPNAGHSPSEPGIAQAFVGATEAFARK